MLTGAVLAQDDSLEVKLPEIQIPDTVRSRVMPDSVRVMPVKRETAPPLPVKKEEIEKEANVLDTVAAYVPEMAVPLAPYGRFVQPLIDGHPLYSMQGEVIFMPSKEFKPESKDELFYMFCVAMVFLGLLRVGFPKYFQDMFYVFWRSPFRQNQIRDQLQQAGMTTLLFNIFFVMSAAIFIYLIVLYTTGYYIMSPWLLFSVCFFSVGAVYVGKFTMLKFVGWMFGQQTVADAYIFIVFLINKILAILLLPFMLLIAFGDDVQQQVAFTIAVVLVVVLLVYRLVLSFSGFRNELRVSLLHLVLYVGAFEIIPVLVIYKLLYHLIVRSS